MCSPSKLSGLSRGAVVALAVGTVSGRPVAAQVNTFHACYVPTVGAMYMIKLAGRPALFWPRESAALEGGCWCTCTTPPATPCRATSNS